MMPVPLLLVNPSHILSSGPARHVPSPLDASGEQMRSLQALGWRLEPLPLLQTPADAAAHSVFELHVSDPLSEHEPQTQSKAPSGASHTVPKGKEAEPVVNSTSVARPMPEMFTPTAGGQS